ncbi:MAG: DUF2442 domain-containing protein [Symploca sp. SIO1B1]|nr:DUF2442 domain-containing protein [Symploca sp. SIO1B1]
MKNTTDREWIDPLDEIRAIRDAHAQKFNYDIDAIFADILKRERARKVIIDEVRYLQGFKIELISHNQTIKQLDLKQYIKSQQESDTFAELQDVECFNKFLFNPSSNTLEWANGATLSLNSLSEKDEINEVSER